MADLLEYVDKDTFSPGFKVTLEHQSISSTFVPTHSTVDVPFEEVSIVSSLLMIASTSENSEEVSMTLLDELDILSETIES